MLATEDGDVSKVVDMVEAEMPVDILDEGGNTALMNAAYNNRTDVVRYLLANGANVDKQNRVWINSTTQKLLSITTLTSLVCYCNMEQVEISRILSPVTHQLIMHVGDKYKEAVDLLEQY